MCLIETFLESLNLSLKVLFLLNEGVSLLVLFPQLLLVLVLHQLNLLS